MLPNLRSFTQMILLVKHWSILISIDLSTEIEEKDASIAKCGINIIDFNLDLKRIQISDMAKRLLVGIGQSNPSDSEIECVEKLAKTFDLKQKMSRLQNNRIKRGKETDVGLGRYS